MFHYVLFFSTSPKLRFNGKKGDRPWDGMGCHGVPRVTHVQTNQTLTQEVCGKNRSPTWDFFDHETEPFFGQQLQL
jgi:hypothetical protein